MPTLEENIAKLKECCDRTGKAIDALRRRHVKNVALMEAEIKTLQHDQNNFMAVLNSVMDYQDKVVDSRTVAEVKPRDPFQELVKKEGTS